MKRIKSMVSIMLVITLFLCGCQNKSLDDHKTVNSEIGNQKDSSNHNDQNEISQDDLADKENELDLDQMSVDEILSRLSLEEKAAQMVQGACDNLFAEEMKSDCFGSILSTVSSQRLDVEGWQSLIEERQKAALESKTKIPFIYGNDSVHGVNTCEGAVIFPHNIGVGAANDPELTYQMGKAVANEMKLTGMLWNFAPCVAVADEPRWGRTYESYSSDYTIVKELATAYTKGLIDGGIVACAKHYLGDGSIEYGTGEGSFLIDRGDAQLGQEELDQLLSVYQSLIDAGVQSIMVNHGSVNGVKMHANKEMIADVLKGKMGFKGVVISDWESIHNIEGDDLKDQVISSINAGIDMLMEPTYYRDCADYIVEGCKEGLISEDRVNDAVRRILTMKKNAGIFKDPYGKDIKSDYTQVGSEEVRSLARQMVERSMVLLKNDNNLLPLKNGMKLYVTGPAMNDTGVLCGGWTIEWEGGMDRKSKYVPDGKTILDGLKELAPEYNLTIITEEDQADEADATILCVGERPYAEWNGDTKDMELTGQLGLDLNEEAIQEAKKLGKPVITLIVAGRNVILGEDFNDWDSVVMCYLPGSEGDGIANVLTGKTPFTGKLAMPWYRSVEDIKTDQVLFPVGYGLE
ncbi:MAG: glycoside hydrolase family 3 protein [Clostridiales bacterium]|nr:glycoside hydrolase family 3 protein [Clostridiales bacterium]